MFNLKRKKQQQVEVATNGYPQVVKDIHNEFMTMSDKILAEAESILANAEDNNFKKAMRLKSIGFKTVPEVVNASSMETAISLTKEASQNIRYYKEKYPFYKFITVDGVNAICRKYGLVCAPVERYMGFVPERNLIEIESFKINKSDISFKFWSKSTYGSQKGEMFNDGGNSGENHSGIYDKVKVYDAMQICAPKHDMNLSGLYLDDYIAKQPVTAPDPVVLQPVNGGYLIATAWGDEASDPIVVNEVNN